MLAGFGLILLFDTVSALWVLLRCLRSGRAIVGRLAMLALGLLCLVLLIGEKAMVDEIGREYQLGWEVLGEWIILYAFLTTQLVYILIILLQVFRARHNTGVVTVG